MLGGGTVFPVIPSKERVERRRQIQKIFRRQDNQDFVVDHRGTGKGREESRMTGDCLRSEGLNSVTGRYGRTRAEKVACGFGLVVSTKEMEEMAPLIWILVTQRENKCINDDGRQFSYYQRSSTNMERKH